MASYLGTRGIENTVQPATILNAVEYFGAFTLLIVALTLYGQFVPRMHILNKTFKFQGRIVPYSARPYHLLRAAKCLLFIGLELLGHAVSFTLSLDFDTGLTGTAAITFLYVLKDREKVIEQFKIWLDHVLTIGADPGNATLFDLGKEEQAHPANNCRWGLYIGRIVVTKPPLTVTGTPAATEESFLANWNGKKHSRWGLAMTNDDCLKMVFFTAALSEQRARIEADTMLRGLSTRFPGITGQVSVHLAGTAFWRKTMHVYEIVLPKSPFRGKLGIIKQFAQVCYAFPKREFELYIHWTQLGDARAARVKERLMERQEFDEVQIDQHRALWHDDLFKVKMYLISRRGLEGKGKSPSIWKLRKMLANIAPEMRDMRINLAGPGAWRTILCCHVHETYTPRGFLTPKMIDFTIQADFPVAHRKDGTASIPLGWLRMDRRTTTMQKYLSLDNLAAQTLVSGGTGMGKSLFFFPFFNTAHELLRERDGASIYFSFEKRDQNDFLHADVVCKFSVDCQARQRPECDRCTDYRGCDQGNQVLEAPLIMELPGVSPVPSIPNACSAITANLGLPEWYTKHVKTVMEKRFEKHRHVQEDLKRLLVDLFLWHSKNPYGPEDQATVMNALKSRANDFNTPYTCWLTRTLDREPNFIQAMRDGKKVLVDLSECTSFETKHLLVLLMLLAIRSRLPKSDKRTTLDYFIVLDEAQEFLEDPDKTGRAREEILLRMMTETNKIIAKMLRTDRGRGLGYAFITQTLSPLYESIYQNTMTKIFFKVTRECAEKVTRKSEDIDRIMEQGRREAFVQDGIAGEQYFITTYDYTPPPGGHANAGPMPAPGLPVKERPLEQRDARA